MTLSFVVVPDLELIEYFDYGEPCQHIALAHLRDSLLRLVMLPRHFGPPARLKTYLSVDQSIGRVDHMNPGNLSQKK